MTSCSFCLSVSVSFKLTFFKDWIIVAGSGILGISISLNPISNHATCTAAFVAVAAVYWILTRQYSNPRQDHLDSVGWIDLHSQCRLVILHSSWVLYLTLLLYSSDCHCQRWHPRPTIICAPRGPLVFRLQDNKLTNLRTRCCSSLISNFRMLYTRLLFHRRRNA